MNHKASLIAAAGRWPVRVFPYIPFSVDWMTVWTACYTAPSHADNDSKDLAHRGVEAEYYNREVDTKMQRASDGNSGF